MAQENSALSEHDVMLECTWDVSINGGLHVRIRRQEWWEVEKKNQRFRPVKSKRAMEK